MRNYRPPPHLDPDGSTTRRLMIEHAFREDWRDLKRRFPALYAERIAALERIAGGKFKRVVATETGTTHAVPVETLATEGIKGDELDRFPEWNDDEHARRIA